MRFKWHFKNESASELSVTYVFSPKSSWNPPTGHSYNELFLSQIEQEFFIEVQNPLGYSNLSMEELETMRSSSSNSNLL